MADIDDIVRTAARAHEPDRYLAALLSPPGARGDLITLAAFAGEIGRVPLTVAEPMMARIRLQWWRDRIEQGDGGGHPVAVAMVAAMHARQLAAAPLLAVIDATEDSVEDRPFASERQLLDHVDRRDGSLFGVAAAICGLEPPPGLIAAAGRAYGLARIGFELPAALAHGRLLLPFEGELLPLELSRITPAIETLAVAARREHRIAADLMRPLSRAERAPFLPIALVEPYLQALQNYAQRSAQPELNPLRRVWALLRCHWTGIA